MPPLRFGLVGCGRLAERGYVEAIGRARGSELTALADPEQARCRRLDAGVPVYRDVAELAADGVADAVIVATPRATHLDCARSAGAAGLPALVEKPPAADTSEAELLAELRPQPAFASTGASSLGWAGCEPRSARPTISISRSGSTTAEDPRAGTRSPTIIDVLAPTSSTSRDG